MTETFVIENHFDDVLIVMRERVAGMASPLHSTKKMILQPNENNDSVRFIIQDPIADAQTEITLTPQQVYMLCSMAKTLTNRRHIDGNRKKMEEKERWTKAVALSKLVLGGND